MALARHSTIQGLLPGLDLCLVPTGVAPHGQHPNFVDAPSLQPALITISAIMMTLSSLVLAGRLFVNRKSMKIPDWMMIVGFVFDLAIVGIQLAVSSRYRHMWDVPVCQIAGFFKLSFIISMATGPALFFPKAAIFLFYIQIFSSARSVKIASYVGIIMAFMAYFPGSLALPYYDAPHVGHSWDELVVSSSIHKGVPTGIAVGVASVIVDIYIFVLPLRTLARLNMPLAKRIQLISLFATAFLGVAASVVSMVYRIKMLSITDATWRVGLLACFIIFENNVAIIVGSLPGFASFMRKYGPELSVCKAICAGLVSSNGGPKREWHKEDQVTAIGGSGKERKKVDYYELDDGSTLQSNITVPGNVHVATDDGYRNYIMRTVMIAQEENKVGSVDRLV